MYNGIYNGVLMVYYCINIYGHMTCYIFKPQLYNSVLISYM